MGGDLALGFGGKKISLQAFPEIFPGKFRNDRF